MSGCHNAWRCVEEATRKSGVECKDQECLKPNNITRKVWKDPDENRWWLMHLKAKLSCSVIFKGSWIGPHILSRRLLHSFEEWKVPVTMPSSLFRVTTSRISFSSLIQRTSQSVYPIGVTVWNSDPWIDCCQQPVNINAWHTNCCIHRVVPPDDEQ
jgi:hypothetical protein